MIGRPVITVACVAMLTGCSQRSRVPTYAAAELEWTAPAESAEPNLFATGDGRAMLTWFEPTPGGHALRVAVRDSGRWTAPQTIAADRDFFVNWADFPSIVELSDGSWVAHWLEKVATSTYAYHVLLSRSTDGGASWSEPIIAHRDESATEHGFVSMVPLPGGEAALVWLDGRNTGGEGHGSMQLRFATTSATGLAGDETLLDDRVCDCCQTALVRTTGGLVAAYRDRSDEEIRDVAVSRFRDGVWSEPVHVGNDNWHFPACPVNGPALAAADDTVVITWFTAADQQPRVFAAISRDGGSSFGAAVRVDDGAPLGRVDVEMTGDGFALATWLERRGDEAEVRARMLDRATAEAGPSWRVAATSQTRASGFPRMVRVGDEIVFAWTIPGGEEGIRVAAARRNGH